MGAEILRVDVRERDTTKVLVLAGELDAFTCDQLRTLGDSVVPGARKVVLNVDKLDYIDSAGLAALVHIWVLAKGCNVELVLTGRNRRVNRIMEITGLDRLFGSHPLFNGIPSTSPPILVPSPVSATSTEKGLSAS